MKTEKNEKIEVKPFKNLMQLLFREYKPTAVESKILAILDSVFANPDTDIYSVHPNEMISLKCSNPNCKILLTGNSFKMTYKTLIVDIAINSMFQEMVMNKIIEHVDQHMDEINQSLVDDIVNGLESVDISSPNPEPKQYITDDIDEDIRTFHEKLIAKKSEEDGLNAFCEEYIKNFNKQKDTDQIKSADSKSVDNQ